MCFDDMMLDHTQKISSKIGHLIQTPPSYIKWQVKIYEDPKLKNESLLMVTITGRDLASQQNLKDRHKTCQVPKKVLTYIYRALKGVSKGRGCSWGTLRIPKEDWGNLKED